MRNDSGGILREVEASATLVITRRGTPVASLSPYVAQPEAIKPARKEAIFDINTLVSSTVPTDEALAALRDDR